MSRRGTRAAFAKGECTMGFALMAEDLFFILRFIYLILVHIVVHFLCGIVVWVIF